MLFDRFSEEVEHEKIKFSGRVIINNKAELKELQVQCMLVGLLYPLFEFMAPIRAENKAIGEDA